MHRQVIRNAIVTLAIVGLIGRAMTLQAALAFAGEPSNFERTSIYGSERVSKIEITVEQKLWDKLRLQKREFVDTMLNPSFRLFARCHGIRDLIALP